MNIRTLLAFYLINSHAQFADRNINEEIANSMIYVIEKFFVPRGSSFFIVMSSERKETRYFYQDLSAILLGSFGNNIKTQILVNEGLKPQPILVEAKMRFLNILVVDSLKSFLNIDLANKVKNFNINEFYHIFLHNKDQFLKADIESILSYCWRNYIFNVNIVIQTASGDIIVYTYFPFSETHCNKVIPVEINRFKNGVVVNAELFPKKLNNMHRCPLRVAPFHSPPFFGLDLSKNSISGFEGQLLKELSFLMNFTIEFVLPEETEDRGSIFSNYTTGAINMLENKIVDLSLGFFWFTQARRQILTASDSYFQTSNVAVLVKDSSNYESPRILWFPFKRLPAVTLIVSFIVMLGMAYVFETFKVLQPARKSRNRCLNFIAWTLGLPSFTLPVQGSKRIFVMTWILFGLVIRSQYAGIIFHLLRNNLFRRSPSTISEVVSQDYTIIMDKEGYNALSQTSVLTDTGLRYEIFEGEGSLFAYLENHSQERLFVITPLGYLFLYMSEHRKAGVLTILKEQFLSQNICIYFTKHSFLVDQVNLLIQRISSAGIFKSWVRQTIDWSYLSSSRQQYEIVIGQRELKGIYYIWLMMMGIAVMVFCMEILSGRFKCLKKIFNKI